MHVYTEGKMNMAVHGRDTMDAKKLKERDRKWTEADVGRERKGKEQPNRGERGVVSRSLGATDSLFQLSAEKVTK
jgi:hypothetical protein